MKIIDYLKAKYGVNRPTTILFAEAKAFGIDYPLQSGWLWRHGDREITPDMLEKLQKNLSAKIRSGKKAASASAGIEVIKKAHVHLKNIPAANSDEFLSSKAWKRIRIHAFEKYGNRCQCCGASPKDGVRLNVDHVKPRIFFPELALCLDNLQILCEDCNSGKGNWNMSDWR